MEYFQRELGKMYLQGAIDMMTSFIAAMGMVQMKAGDNEDIRAFSASLQEVIIGMRQDLVDKFEKEGVTLDG